MALLTHRVTADSSGTPRQLGTQQGLASHAVVAAVIVRRHAGLVAPEELHAIPRDVVAMANGEASIQSARCTAARQRHRRRSVLPNSPCQEFRDVLRRRHGEIA
jgi:hypothetical protein